MNRTWQEEGYRASLKRIKGGLTGIERIVGFALFAPWVLLPSFWIQMGFHHWRPEWRTQAIEAYVFVCMILTILNWCLGPTFWGNIGCSYISASTIITLLQVTFLHTLFGDMHSAKRSMILLIFNVVQILFMYAAWYQLETTRPEQDILLHTLFVFATIGHPEDVPHIIIELQIATNFILLVVFLNHLVSRWAPR